MKGQLYYLQFIQRGGRGEGWEKEKRRGEKEREGERENAQLKSRNVQVICSNSAFGIFSSRNIKITYFKWTVKGGVCI